MARRLILGFVALVVLDSSALAFDPARLTDGLDLSDDPFPDLRSDVYALSVKYRHKK